MALCEGVWRCAEGWCCSVFAVEGADGGCGAVWWDGCGAARTARRRGRLLE